MDSPLKREKPDYLRSLPATPAASAGPKSIPASSRLSPVRQELVVLSRSGPLAEEPPESSGDLGTGLLSDQLEKPSLAAAVRQWRADIRLYLSLMKPITWVPVVWSFWCGATGAGGLVASPEALLRLLGGLLLAGPLLCGMSQAINDYFDREVDAVNEPWRVLPSGRLNLRQVYQLIAGLGFAGLLIAYCLGPVVTGLAFFGIFMAHHYSAPPLRLKRFTWLGPFTSSLSYILVPWLAAASVFGGITWRSAVLAGLYAAGGTGIMILNDFKSIRGDYQLRLPSVPVVYGTRRAAILASLIIDAAQLAVSAFLLAEGRWLAAALIVVLLLPQLVLQRLFIRKPLARAVWYNARAQNFLVLGMLLASWLAA